MIPALEGFTRPSFFSFLPLRLRYFGVLRPTFRCGRVLVSVFITNTLPVDSTFVVIPLGRGRVLFTPYPYPWVHPHRYSNKKLVGETGLEPALQRKRLLRPSRLPLRHSPMYFKQHCYSTQISIIVKSFFEISYLSILEGLITYSVGSFAGNICIAGAVAFVPAASPSIILLSGEMFLATNGFNTSL